MFSYFHAVVLGVIEGLTEFLPISSTGHLVLAAEFLKISETDFVKSFEIIIQLGAITAVAGTFFRNLFSWELIKRLVVAFVPTGILGILLYSVVKTYLLGNAFVVVCALALGGVVLVVFERFVTVSAEEITEADIIKRIETMRYRDAVIVGLCQAVAMIPGVSRSAATIVGARGLGYSRRVAVAFSFLLAVPTMLAASGLAIVKNFRLFTADTLPLLAVGFVVSALTAFVAVKWLLTFVRSHSFAWFGLYRIVLALGVWLILR